MFIGPAEAILIVGLIALLAGPKLIPRLSNALGRTTKAAQAGFVASKPDETPQRSE